MELISLLQIMYFFLVFVLGAIIIFAISSVYQSRKKILKELKKHKKIYVALFVIFLIGTLLRVPFFLAEHHIFADYKAYVDSAHCYSKMWSFETPDDCMPDRCDSNSFATLMSGFESLSDPLGMSRGSLLSSIFGSLNIIALYIWLSLFTRRRPVGLFSSLLLSGSVLNIHTSIAVRPYEASLFFMLLALIFLEMYIRTRKNLLMIFCAITIGWSTQFYYIEAILIPLVILRLLLLKMKTASRVNLLTIKNVIILVLVPWIIYLPFLIVQGHPDFVTTCFAHGDDNSLLCKYAVNQCGGYSAHYIFDPVGKNNYHGPLNVFGGHLPQYLTYQFLGVEKKFDHIFQFENYQSNVHNIFNAPLREKIEASTFDYGSILCTLLVLLYLGFMIIRRNPDIVFIFLASVLISFIFIFAPFESIMKYWIVYSNTLGWIPLLSYCSLQLFPKNRILTATMLLIITLAIILPYFIHDTWNLVAYHSFYFSN